MPKSAQAAPQETSTTGVDTGAKIAIVSKEVEITSVNTFAEVLDYDQKGYRIMFACEKGQLLKLSEAELEQLSGYTKRIYGVMKQQNISQEAEDPDWTAIKTKFKVGDSKGSAAARMKVTAKDPIKKAGMETRHFRPDNMGTAEAKGWIPAKVSDYNMAGSHTGHISIKAHGEDELILCERPKSFRIEAEKQRREAKAKRAEAEKREYEETAARTGYRPLKDAEVVGGKFKDIE